jgi:uncharacterized protein (DUF983 family)
MSFLGYLWTCSIRSRCPCCGEGRLFRGWLAFRETCDRCGLVYDQWIGEWVSPTWVAHTIGFLLAMALFAWMLVTGRGMSGPIPPELTLAVVAAGVSVILLRPSKAAWLALLYWAGGIEVTAETRAWMHWFALKRPDAPARHRAPEASRAEGARADFKASSRTKRALEAERRARRPPPRAAADYTRGGGLGPFLRDLFFPKPRR